MSPKQLLIYLLSPYTRMYRFSKSPQDDLTIIKGIGPNIQRLFYHNNIKSWKSLSECSVQECQFILNAAGETYKMHNPKHWPDQARMAYKGRWKVLRVWQKKLFKQGGVLIILLALVLKPRKADKVWL